MRVGDYVKLDGQFGVIIGFNRVASINQATVQLSDGRRRTLPSVELEQCESCPIERLKRGLVCEYPEDFYYHLAAKRLELRNRFEPYTFLANSRLVLQPHQVFVAHKVTQKMYPRYILADEVGLGKTIEAGMIMKELKARGYAKRILIVVPAGLVTQWQREMDTKFNEHFTIYNREALNYFKSEYPKDDPWLNRDNVLVSLQFARRKEIALAITGVEWDLVIFDEAHHLRSQLDYEGKETARLAYRLGQAITPQTKAMLLLTATPMQLQDFEFYSMTKLIDPVLFKDYESFKEYRNKIPTINKIYGDLLRFNELDRQGVLQLARGINRALYPENRVEETVRKLNINVERKKLAIELMDNHPLAEIMVRNRKKSVGGFAQRTAFTIKVSLSLQEQDLYNEVSDYVKVGYRTAIAHKRFVVGFLLVIYQKLLTSSTFSVAQSFERRIAKITQKREVTISESEVKEYSDEYDDINLMWEKVLASAEHSDFEEAKLRGLIAKARAIKVDTKLQQLTKVLKEIFINPDEKVLIFTQFKDTLDYLQNHLGKGWKVVTFHGGLNIAEKDQATEDFRTRGQIMISTDSGGEGRNFQFCHNLINYDLPWNPMKIEQRIGRVDRFGQRFNVNIYNFSIQGTIEDRVFSVLNDRIKIFEDTIGGLEPILGDLEKKIERVIISHKDNARELIRFEKDLLTEVYLAQETEKKMRDFIMDVSSFDGGTSEKVMLKDTKNFYTEIQSFVLDFLGRYHAFRPEEQSPGIFWLEIPQVFRDSVVGLPYDNKLPPIRDYYRAAFSPTVASENENTTSFIAFGHELLQAIIGYCKHKLPETTAAYYLKCPTDIPPQKGVLFNFLVQFRGIQEKQTIIPIFVNMDLEASVDMGFKIFTLRPQTGEKPGYNDLDIDIMHEAAQEMLVPMIVGNLSGYKEESIQKLNVEKARIRKFSEYKTSLEREEIEKIHQRIKELKTEKQRQIIPVWKKEIQDHYVSISKWEKYRDRKLAELDKVSHDSYSFDLFSAAVIEIVN